MLFDNAHSLKYFIDGRIDKVVNREEAAGPLQGNIQVHLANDYEHKRLLTTENQASILGRTGDFDEGDIIYYTDGTCTSLADRRSMCPRSFYDDGFPVLNSGNSTFGINDYNEFKDNPNIGYTLNKTSKRSINFPYYASPGSTLQANDHSPKLVLKTYAGTKAPHYTSYKANYGINDPVGNWANLNPAHGHGHLSQS